MTEIDFIELVRETPLHDFHDVFLAKSCAEILQNQFRFAHEKKAWFEFVNGRYSPVDGSRVHREMVRFSELVKKSGESLLATAKQQRRQFAINPPESPEAAQAAIIALEHKARFLLGQYKRMSTKRRLEDLQKLVSQHELISTSFNLFDSDTGVINLRNGLFDLQNYSLIDHSADQLNTKMMNVQFDLSAECPNFKSAMDRMFATNKDVIGYIQRFLGYCLTGGVSEEVFLLLLGYGRNGKSVTCNLLDFLWGDYAAKAAPSLLSRNSSLGGPTPEVVALKGLRIAICSELPAAGALSEHTIKDIVSREKLTGRDLYEKMISFPPTHKIIASSNHRPNIKGTEDGIWRRIVAIPFKEKFTKENGEIPNLDKILESEADGIFNWILEGLRKYRESGLSLPPSLKQENDLFREESNVVAMFLEQATKKGEGERVLSQDLFDGFGLYCNYQGTRRFLNQKLFSEKMLELGYRKIKSNGCMKFEGLDFDSESQFFKMIPNDVKMGEFGNGLSKLFMKTIKNRKAKGIGITPQSSS